MNEDTEQHLATVPSLGVKGFLERLVEHGIHPRIEMDDSVLRSFFLTALFRGTSGSAVDVDIFVAAKDYEKASELLAEVYGAEEVVGEQG